MKHFMFFLILSSLLGSTAAAVSNPSCPDLEKTDESRLVRFSGQIQGVKDELPNQGHVIQTSDCRIRLTLIDKNGKELTGYHFYPNGNYVTITGSNGAASKTLHTHTTETRPQPKTISYKVVHDPQTKEITAVEVRMEPYRMMRVSLDGKMEKLATTDAVAPQAASSDQNPATAEFDKGGMTFRTATPKDIIADLRPATGDKSRTVNGKLPSIHFVDSHGHQCDVSFSQIPGAGHNAIGLSDQKLGEFLAKNCKSLHGSIIPTKATSETVDAVH